MNRAGHRDEQGIAGSDWVDFIIGLACYLALLGAGVVGAIFFMAI